MSNSKTLHGLEHEAIDNISAAMLFYETQNVAKARETLKKAIALIVEMRIVHDRLMADLDPHP